MFQPPSFDSLIKFVMSHRTSNKITIALTVRRIHELQELRAFDSIGNLHWLQRAILPPPEKFDDLLNFHSINTQ
jgi:hypothetical protein